MIVMIQTLQAFLFAIVMILVIKSGSAYVSATNDNKSAGMAMGVVGIVGLASISKLEKIIKDMLGTGPTLTDPSLRGGMKSFATGMVAAKLAGRVANNIGNFTGGIKKIASSNKNKKLQNQRKLKYGNAKFGLNDSNTDPNYNVGTSDESGGNIPDESLNASIHEQQKKVDDLKNYQVGMGGVVTDENGNYLKETADQRQKKINEEQSKLNSLLSKANMGQASLDAPDFGTVQNFNTPSSLGQGGQSVPVTNSSQGQALGKQISRDDAVAYQQYIDQCDDKIKELSTKRNEGVKDIIKGVTGTVGAVTVGTMGVGLGAAMGEMDDILKYAGAGMGVGDYIGEKVVELPAGGVDLVKSINKGIKNGRDNKKLEKSLNAQKAKIDELMMTNNIDIGNQS